MLRGPCITNGNICIRFVAMIFVNNYHVTRHWISILNVKIINFSPIRDTWIFFRHFYVEILANFFFLIRSFYSVDKVFAFNVLTWWSYLFFRLPVGCFEIALVDKLIYYKWNFRYFRPIGIWKQRIVWHFSFSLSHPYLWECMCRFSRFVS